MRKRKERIDGRLAIMLLVEHSAGYHKNYDEKFLGMLRQKQLDFYVYLRRKGLKAEEVQRIIEGIKEDTRRELRTDWVDAFRISSARSDADMEMEVDIFGSHTSDPAKQFDHDVNQDLSYWRSMAHTAAINAEKQPWERWSRALAHLEHIDRLVNQLERKHAHAVLQHMRYELTNKGEPPKAIHLSSGETRLLGLLTLELRHLRFGKIHYGFTFINIPGRRFRLGVQRKTSSSLHNDGIFISANMWKKMQNRINRLKNVSKRYIVQEYEKVHYDALEIAVYGLDLDNWRP